MAIDPYAPLPAVPSFTLVSNDLEEGKPLPTVHRSGIFGAGGEDRSPHLAWSGFPLDTRSFAVTVYDPDAPTVSGIWHWVVMDIPATTTELPAGAGDPGGAGLPAGAVQLRNDAGAARFLGAAPPEGHGPHRYIFVVHALDTESIGLPADVTPAFLQLNLLGHTLARAKLTATSET